MPRKINPQSRYHLYIHRTRQYLYASSQEPYVDPVTGKRKYRRIHWGTLDAGLKFHPGAAFRLASSEERRKLIFPDEWDLSEICLERDGAPPVVIGDYRNLLYGEIWLLQQTANQTGLLQDLMTVFQNDRQTVSAILTLAMFTILHGDDLDLVPGWQMLMRTPCESPLDAAGITRLLHSITPEERDSLLQLRMKRFHGRDMCMLDTDFHLSTGASCLDQSWPGDQVLPSCEKFLAVMIYTADQHIPVFYRFFPDVVQNSLCQTAIYNLREELEDIRSSSIILVTNRGYSSLNRLSLFLEQKVPLLTTANVRYCGAEQTLSSITNVNMAGMEAEAGTDTEAKSKSEKSPDIPPQLLRKAGSLQESDPQEKKQWSADPDNGVLTCKYGQAYTPLHGRVKFLNLYLFLDPQRREATLEQLRTSLETQRADLEQLKKTEAALPPDPELFLKRFPFFTIQLQRGSWRNGIFGNRDYFVVHDYQENPNAIQDVRLYAGCQAAFSHVLDLSTAEVLHHVQLQSEQKQFFDSLAQMTAVRESSTASVEPPGGERTGLALVKFAAHTMFMQLSRIWQTTELRTIYPDPRMVLTAMSSIRYLEYGPQATYITPLTPEQITICRAFNVPPLNSTFREVPRTRDSSDHTGDDTDDMDDTDTPGDTDDADDTDDTGSLMQPDADSE